MSEAITECTCCVSSSGAGGMPAVRREWLEEVVTPDPDENGRVIGSKRRKPRL